MPSPWLRALFVLAIASSASAQTVPTIGLYADSSATDCNVVTTAGIPVTAYVVLVPRIAPASLAEARIQIRMDFPDVDVTDVVPTASASLATGNPFTAPSPGALLRVQLCPTSTPFVLYRVTLLRPSGPSTEIRVETIAQWTTCSLETFTTRSVNTIDHEGIPSAPANPSPPDGATVVSACNTGGHQTLTWSGQIEATTCRSTYWRVYFGASSNPPFVWAQYSFPGYDAGRLSYNTTYYWRVDTVVHNFGDPNETNLPGPLWQFTTGPSPEALPPLTCPTTCDTPPTPCPRTCLFTSDPALASQCSDAVRGWYTTGRDCGSSHSVDGRAYFDKVLGLVSVQVQSDSVCGGASTDVLCTDRFWIEGPASSEPIAFSAYLSFGGSQACLFAGLREGPEPVTFSPPAGPQQYQGHLELPLRHVPGETFVLRYGVMALAMGMNPPRTGYTTGNLGFSTLPAGYTIMSCQGFAGPQAITPTSWSSVKKLFR